MLSNTLSKNVRYYGSYQMIYVIVVILLSSIGAFFHFLLDHEISIVESWLHNNRWEILISSKLISLYLLNRWFKVRLYELKGIRVLIRELVHWPQTSAVVVAFFMLIGFLSVGDVVYTGQNLGYWYNHMASYCGLFLFFGIEFIVIAYLDDVLNQEVRPSLFKLGLIYTFLFTAAFRLSVPDYYGQLSYVVFCFSTLIYLSGKSFKSWSNVVCFLVIFLAPMGSLVGLDPVWGDDFSPFHLKTKLSLTLLAVFWMISFLYYKYRDQVITGTRKLVR